ncbi:uncharacterized protein [Euphorbia lathyris]|uniref:uncharacterized protein isoform X2 n=1 Tax=Euphorbia lathyris TaxID=212925 RepID=UPI003313BF6F
MSMLSKNNSSNNMSTPSFHDFKKQASFFLKEKIKSARLALTDVTPAQLLTEEAANGNPWAPDTRILGSISKAAFELDDYWRIVEILHKRFNWGLTVRKKSERILKLLEKEHLLKEERDRARKLTRGIRGFGSFSQRNSSGEGVLQESSHSVFARSNSQFTDHRTSENHFFSSNEENVIQEEGNSGKGRHNLISDNNFSGDWMNEKPEVSCKENTTPKEEDLHRWNHIYEDNPLLEERKDEVTITEESHPFSAKEMETTSSLLSPRNGI